MTHEGRSTECRYDIATVLTARDHVRAALVDFQAAFFCLNILPQMVEEIRILSLNAELAAGRAGVAAAPIRVATQNTRGIVSQLIAITERMNRARYRSYRYGALAMRGLPRLARFARTASRVEASGSTHAASGLAAVRAAQEARAAEILEEVGGLIAGGNELRSLAQALDGLVRQSGAIASSLSILATAAPGHEKEFTTVARAMKRLVDVLSLRARDATTHVERGLDNCRALTSFTRTCASQLRSAA